MKLNLIDFVNTNAIGEETAVLLVPSYYYDALSKHEVTFDELSDKDDVLEIGNLEKFDSFVQDHGDEYMVEKSYCNDEILLIFFYKVNADILNQTVPISQLIHLAMTSEMIEEICVTVENSNQYLSIDVRENTDDESTCKLLCEICRQEKEVDKTLYSSKYRIDISDEGIVYLEIILDKQSDFKRVVNICKAYC